MSRVRKRSRPRISLALIARDEEQFLGNCLASAKGVVDEIVVVDTGSADRTVAIAQAHGAKVFDFKWIDDFSAARNEALQRCTCDWVLSLDADEVLVADTAHHIREEIARNHVDAWYLTLVGVSASGEEHPPVRLLRLFRRTRSCRYFGRIHEQVDLGIRGVVGGHSQSVIRHFGYDPKIYRSRKKEERNRRLLQQALAESRANGDVVMQSCYMYYSVFHEPDTRKLKLLEEFAEFCDAHRKALPERVAWVPSGLMLLALELRRMGRMRRMGDLAAQMLDSYGEAPYLFALIAESQEAAGEFELAERNASMALDPACPTGPRHREYVVDSNLAMKIAAPVMGRLLERSGRESQAEKLYRRFSGSVRSLETSLALYEIKRGEFDAALERLTGLNVVEALDSDVSRLGLVAAVASRSVSGLIRWGDRVRESARTDSRSQSLLRSVEHCERGVELSREALVEMLRSAGFVLVDRD